MVIQEHQVMVVEDNTVPMMDDSLVEDKELMDTYREVPMDTIVPSVQEVKVLVI